MSDIKVLHQANDQFGTISVIDDDHFRILSFGDNDEQSKMLRLAPYIPQHTYVQAMLLSLLFIKPKSAIILGLGGGALIHALRHCDAAIKLTAVELRADVIDIAKRYFQLPIGKKLQLVNQDANVFLQEKLHKKVDVIYADMYVEQGVDKNQLTEVFITSCLQQLKTDGLLVLNCWKEHSRDQQLLAHLKAQFSEVFACLTNGGNWVVFATNTPGCFEAANNKAAIQALSQQLEVNVSRSLNRFGPWE
ncbi:spermidine synthase [Shewanella sp. SR44-3]|uniref:spermidine synthase n=1 Tax=unclassified Shewanella TaxID=196818 RepID=UPI0015FC6141|nr:fused MFS/spermidine synthase [Shewanella sp. SR44-3]MBB1270770.1 fused MFS/spermidine synthase [Shewanella sp. SR44-3]